LQEAQHEAGFAVGCFFLAVECQCLGADGMGRPMFGPPGVPAERLNLLREAFAKTMNDEQFRAEVKNATTNSIRSAEELEKLAKEVTTQPPDVIERLKKLLGN
jgi:tripartite-type tricarboxylate transporter receptor subunit TctC